MSLLGRAWNSALSKVWKGSGVPGATSILENSKRKHANSNKCIMVGVSVINVHNEHEQ